MLDAGSSQKDVWGADWIPVTQEVTCESLINLRPGQGNFSMDIRDKALRAQIEQITTSLLGER